MKRITQKTLENLVIEVYNGSASRVDILQGYTTKQLTKLKNQLQGPQITHYSTCIIEIGLPGWTQEKRYNELYSWRAKGEIVYQSGTILKNLIVEEIRNQKINLLEL